MFDDFDRMSDTELRRRIARKEISPVEVTKRALAKAEETQATLNAFFFLMSEEALAAGILVDPQSGALMGGADPRSDGAAIGY